MVLHWQAVKNGVKPSVTKRLFDLQSNRKFNDLFVVKS